MSDVLIDNVISTLLGIADYTTSESGIDALIECLLEAGIIVDRELSPPPPIEEISDNRIDDGLMSNVNVECTGSSCETLLQAQLTNSNSLGSSTAPNINTDTSEFQGTADSPIIAQGTGDSSALAKIAKLKKQWVDLIQ
jgi:hypothetical protein